MSNPYRPTGDAAATERIARLHDQAATRLGWIETQLAQTISAASYRNHEEAEAYATNAAADADMIARTLRRLADEHEARRRNDDRPQEEDPR